MCVCVCERERERERERNLIVFNGTIHERGRGRGGGVIKEEGGKKGNVYSKANPMNR